MNTICALSLIVSKIVKRIMIHHFNKYVLRFENTKIFEKTRFYCKIRFFAYREYFFRRSIKENSINFLRNLKEQNRSKKVFFSKNQEALSCRVNWV